MTRFSMVATALVIGLLAGSAANVRANSKEKKDHKDKGHKFIGLSPVDFPHKGHGDKDNSKKDHGDKDCKGHDHCGKNDCGKDNCGKDNCGKDNCGNNKPPKENMGGSNYSPPGTPGNPVMPTKPPKTPIRFPPAGFYGNKNLTGGMLKGLHDPLKPTKPAQGKIPTLGTGINGLAGAIGKDVGNVVGFGVTEAIKGVGSVASAVGDLASGVGNAVGDLASGVGNALESLL